MKRRPPCSRRPLIARLKRLQNHVHEGNYRAYLAEREKLPVQTRGVLCLLGFYAGLRQPDEANA